MLSVTHQLLYGSQPGYQPLADAPLLTYLRRGIRNRAGPIPHVSSTWWSVSALFAHLATMAQEPTTCPLMELRDKCIVLLKLDSFARAADLAEMDEVKRLANGDTTIVFHLSKHHRTRQEMTIRMFKPDPRICTAQALFHYWARSLHDEIPARKRLVDGVETDLYPLFRTTTKNKKTDTLETRKALTAQRIANITRKVMTAAGIHSRYKPHTTRGAAASKCYNLGIPLKDVVARGRWQNEDTFIESYLKECRYLGVQAAWASQPFEHVLRLQVARA